MSEQDFTLQENISTENQNVPQPQGNQPEQSYQDYGSNPQGYQPQQSYQDYGSNPQNNSLAATKNSRNATVGLIMGLISIIAWLLPFVGYPVTIIGIVFSAKGFNAQKNGQAIAGLVLSVIFLIATIINSIAGALMALA